MYPFNFTSASLIFSSLTSIFFPLPVLNTHISLSFFSTSHTLRLGEGRLMGRFSIASKSC